MVVMLRSVNSRGDRIPTFGLKEGVLGVNWRIVKLKLYYSSFNLHYCMCG